MLTTDIQRVKEFYKTTLARFGVGSARALNWQSDDSQQIRYKIFLENALLEGKSILDVGCGLGDFYGFLHSRLNNFEYKGIDVVPELIAGARKKYPTASFETADMLSYDGPGADYVFASGVFSFTVQNSREVYFSAIKKYYGLARGGFGFNMLKKLYHVDDDLYVTYYPQDVVNYCQSMCKDVKLVEGYLPHDFTVFMYKDRV